MSRARTILRRHGREWLRTLLHCASALTLLIAMPGASQLAREVVSVLTLDDCCEHACDSEECCPGQCLDCRYCAHASALTLAAMTLPLAPAVAVPCRARLADLHPFAYVSPPARPPSA